MQTTTTTPATELQRVRGMNDFLPPAATRLRRLAARMHEFLDLYGYQLIETPVLEPLELFLRKSGDEITARTYSFTHWNRQLCLRPELTASVMRAYVNGMQERALPLRLQYAGPSFRYEKPQRGRYRQFTQLGIECIGASGPAADAEVLRIACGALDAVGMRGHRVVLGHLGAVLELLAQLGLTPHGRALILGAMEHLARRGADPDVVTERILLLLGHGEPGENGRSDADGALLPGFVDRLGAEDAARVAADLLALGGLPIEGGSRSPHEIVSRLLQKTSRADPVAPVRTAIDFIVRLHRLAGPPDVALPQLAELLRAHHLDTAPLDDIRRALDVFACYDAPAVDVTVDLSLGRGLWYYTGLVFEIYADAAGAPLQVCGGGRYDDLIRALGGRAAAPACGFAFGLERVDLALPEPAPPAPACEALVAPLEAADLPCAIRAAEALRRAGVRTELDLRARGARGALRRADRAGIQMVVLVGARERERGEVLLRRLDTRVEQRVPLDDLAAHARGAPPPRPEPGADAPAARLGGAGGPAGDPARPAL